MPNRRLVGGIVRHLAIWIMLAAVVLAGGAAPANAGSHYDQPEFAYDELSNTTGVGTVAVGELAAQPVPSAGGAAGSPYDSSGYLYATNAIPRLGSLGDEVAAARAHLRSIPDALEYGPNRAMLNSIDDAIASGRPLTAAERNFLDHELLEASYVGRGMSQEAAHALTLESVPAASNYSPSVIQQFPDHFSDYYFDYWGISR